MTDYDNFCAICGADMERSGLQNVSRFPGVTICEECAAEMTAAEMWGLINGNS